MKTLEGLTISDAAAETGLTTHTLRYYERAGLMLDPVDRAPSSHRRYSSTDLKWIRFLTKLRATGMSIQQMRDYTDLVKHGSATESERLEMLEAHRSLVKARLK